MNLIFHQNMKVGKKRGNNEHASIIQQFGLTLKNNEIIWPYDICKQNNFKQNKESNILHVSKY